MKRCKCENRRLRLKWVVIERRCEPLSSRLKCLACGIKWWSKAKYVRLLKDHTERSRRGMTDQDILERLLDGSLWVQGETVFTASSSSPLAVEKKTSNGSTYDFVTVCSGGRKKKIALHRLVWMAHHRQLVPEGFDVDHVLGKEIPSPNAIENLRLLESSVNRSLGKPCCEF